MNDPTKNCSEIILLLDAYHDNEVTKAEKEIVETHLANCPSCTDNLKQIASLVQSLKSLPVLETSCDLTDKLDSLLPKATVSSASIVPAKPEAKVIAFAGYKFALVAAAACASLTILALRFMPKGAVEVATTGKEQVIGAQVQINNKPGKVTAKEKLASKQELAMADEPKVAVAVGSSKNDTEHQAAQTANKHELATNVGKESKLASLADKQNEQVPVAVTATNVPQTNSNNAMATQQETLPGDETPAAEIATVYEGEPRGTAESIGIATDEDGLYALKL
jgi:hypothetical protein